MKRLIFAGLVLTLCSGSGAFAQSNGGYVDDVYYNGSQAQKDAKSDAKKQKQRDQQDNAEHYNSSTGYDDGYNTGGDARVYNSSYSDGDDTYIDYDDDSYTSRIRRFYYPMYNVGYWGSVYSPFWYDPFYYNPYYGWGGWYTPGFSMGIGWGFGPYWNNCWGINTWFGYGMFNSWYYPYGGWGWGWGGYGAGYWNGYYAGLYDGGRYSIRNVANYGPRGNRNGLLSNGAYGRNNGMRRLDNNGNIVQPINGRSSLNGSRQLSTADRGNNGSIQLNNGGTLRRDNNSRLQVENPRNQNRISSNDAIRLSNNERAVEVNQGAAAQRVQPAQESRRGGFFGNIFRGNNNSGIERSAPRYDNNRMQRSSGFEQRSQPARNFSSPSPSRSYSSPSPSRSGGSFGGGGGVRMGGRR